MQSDWQNELKFLKWNLKKNECKKAGIETNSNDLLTKKRVFYLDEKYKH